MTMIPIALSMVALTQIRSDANHISKCTMLDFLLMLRYLLLELPNCEPIHNNIV